MTPKEKAEEMFNKYWIYLRAGLLYDEEAKEDAKHCALIAVNELIKEVVDDKESEYISLKDIYWMEVKKEIEKIII